MSQLQGDTVKIAVIDGQAESCSGLMLARYQIESRFRALNNNLKIRSLFLQSEERIKSLILVNILALLVYSLIEWVYQQKRLATSGRDALDSFRSPTIIVIIFPSGNFMLFIDFQA